MGDVVVKRGPRAAAPPPPDGRVDLAEPPILPEEAQLDLSSAMAYLPMMMGIGAMALIFSMGSGSSMMYLLVGMMGVSMISMTIMQVFKPAMERRRKMRTERRDYLRYLDQIRDQAREAADAQRVTLSWDHPEPDALWRIPQGSRLWERRAGHEDFARVRIGRGTQQAALELAPPMTRPIEDLEPLCAIALRRFTRAYSTVPGLPLSVSLRRFTSVEFAGEADAAAALVRALVAQLVVWHSPDELRLALLVGPEQRASWDWAKWLPHLAHTGVEDDTGPARVAAVEEGALLDLLGNAVLDRPDHDPDAATGPTEPFTVVVAHGAEVPDRSRLYGAGIRNVVLLDLTGALPGGDSVLRLTVTGGTVEFPSGDGTGTADADALSLPTAERLARSLAPLRTSGTIDVSSAPLETDFELTELLGIRDPRGFDVPAAWRPRQALRARLLVPIGVTEEGEVVELDLKESAQGGMGPHGVLIGATGSGKSELLRTLVIGLAATHSSEVLNFVLVDFKGGATFLGTERLPHTSAVITNLVDELPLVDRMQDSINGELVRRQELLRAAGYSSLYDYEKARAAGAAVPPLPVLFVVVDEFSELLGAKPEFMDLFVQIGRLGRSLGVHLLLASQRLDEGRIHRVEGHLSYRIALRTFSAMESRSVIGVTSAAELPSVPGNGYLKIGSDTLVRFKSAYVSGPVAEVRITGSGAVGGGHAEIAPFGLLPGRLRDTADEVVEVVEEDKGDLVAGESAGADEDSLMDVLVDRLTGQGAAARQVWLPPLAESPPLDQLLPGLVPDPHRGMTAPGHPALRTLRVPLGIVDRPYEQSRELLVADLAGAGGNVGIAGATQSGKSTLLRTLMLSLALTHTPAEVQFYCLDLAGGGLVPLAGLPHVGSVATRLDRDRVMRTVEEIAALLEHREQIFAEQRVESVNAYRSAFGTGRAGDRYGDVFLVVDGWPTLRKDFDELEPRINEIASRGLSFGIHVVVTANRWSEIRPATRDLLGSRFELRMGDPIESEFGARTAALVPDQPGRGLTTGKHHFLGCLPRTDGSSGVEDVMSASRAAAEEIAAYWGGPTAPEVRLLPMRLEPVRVPAPRRSPRGDLVHPIGLDEKRLDPVEHDFGIVPHLLVLGDAETGKTALLRGVCRSIVATHRPDQAKILLVDGRRQLVDAVPEAYRVGYAVNTSGLSELAQGAAVSMNKRIPGSDITPDQLSRRDWWSGPRLFVIVDDYDLVGSGTGLGGPMEPLLPLLAQGASIGMHLVLARSTSGAMRAMMDPLLRRMWELQSPAVLFSYPKEEGKFLGEAKPRTLPAGRAQLVTRRGIRLVQTVDHSDPAPVSVAASTGARL